MKLHIYPITITAVCFSLAAGFKYFPHLKHLSDPIGISEPQYIHFIELFDLLTFVLSELTDKLAPQFGQNLEDSLSCFSPQFGQNLLI